MSTDHVVQKLDIGPTAALQPIEIALANQAAGIETQAVTNYRTCIEAADSGRLGVVPTAVRELLEVVLQRHCDALESWNLLLAAAGSAPELHVTAATRQPVDLADLADQCRRIESETAAAYQAANGELTSVIASGLSALIEPSAHHHIAMFDFLLGEYPTAACFAGIEGALR